MRKLVYFALGNFCRDKQFGQALKQLFAARDVAKVHKIVEVGWADD